MCELSDLLDFAKRYAALGSAVQDQLEDLVQCHDTILNDNAIHLIHDKLGGKNEELDEILEEYFETIGRR